MYQQSAVLLWALYWVLEGMGKQPVSPLLLVVTGLLLGTYWSVTSNLIIEATQEVTDGAGFTVGHQQMFGAWLAYKIAGKIGNKGKEHDVDHVQTPGFIALFFDNGTLAVFANKAGGRRAAAIIPLFAGMIQVFGFALVLNILKDGPKVIGWMGMFDWATLWSASVLLTDKIGILIPIIMIPLLMVVPQLQYRRHKETYFTTMRDSDS